MDRKGSSSAVLIGAIIAGAGAFACRVDVSTPEPVAGGEAAAVAVNRVPSENAATSEKSKINPRLLRRFAPIPDTAAAEDAAQSAKVALGRMLFFDQRLSLAEDLSCNSCHELESYGVDREPTSVGAKGKRGTRNSPSVYHAALGFSQFWDGRSPHVEAQAKGPILNAAEMAMPSSDAVVARLRQVPGYVDAFGRAFPGEARPLSYDNVANAIGAFERGLVTPSRWDDFLRGNEAALSDAEVEGLKVFTDVGCMVCHTGTLLGGNSYQRTGAVQPWSDQTDQGRYQVTKDPADKMMFKVPTLRNVAETAPYFHDGSVASLADAVRAMGKHQLGLNLEEAEVTAIVTWLKSLTGELPKAYIARPELPGRGAQKDPT